MIVFSDYQCPYCSSWNQDTLPAMMAYVDDDQLRIEWRDLNVFGKQLHTTSVITGLLIAGVGVLFWTTNGLVSAPSLLPTEIDRWMQSHSGLLASHTANAIAVGVIAVVIILIWALRQRKQYRRRIHEQEVTS